MFIFFFITGIFGKRLDFLLHMVVVLLWHWMVVIIIFNGLQLVRIVSNSSVSYFGTVDISSWDSFIGMLQALEVTGYFFVEHLLLFSFTL